MLNPHKIRIMSQLASYEKGEGKKYLPISRFYRSDYIGLALIKNFFLVTLAYGLILLLVGVYFAEELLENINDMNLVGIAVGLIFLYLVFLVCYTIIVYIIRSVTYSRAKRSVQQYYSQMGTLTRIYMREDEKR